MAKADVKKESVVKEVTVTLSPAEADALVTTCQFIGGSPSKSARMHMTAISNALHNKGVTYYGSRYKDDINRGYGTGLTFKDSKKDEGLVDISW